MSSKSEHLVDLIFKKLKNYKSKEIFLKHYLEKNLIKQPLEQEFQNASGGIKKINLKLLIFVQLLFLGLFLFFTFLTIYSIYLVFKRKFSFFHKDH